MKYIYIQPISEVREELLDYLVIRLEGIYGYPCRIALPVRVPESSYSADRDQYNAEVIVEKMMEKMPIDAEKLLCVVDFDLFVPGLNFVFGLAASNTAVISMVRLRPEYYGEKKNEYLFRERALKEAIHEPGYTFGLYHCSDVGCIMHFSNCLEDTDIKDPGFCKVCSNKIGGSKGVPLD
jgi:archaemetzincin